jgi:hypothetical protein
VFENRVLKRIFGSVMEEIPGGQRKLQNEKIHNLYFSPNIITAIKLRTMKCEVHVPRMGKKRNAYKYFLGVSEWKRSLGKHRCRWQDNIRIGLSETGF